LISWLSHPKGCGFLLQLRKTFDSIEEKFIKDSDNKSFEKHFKNPNADYSD